MVLSRLLLLAAALAACPVRAQAGGEDPPPQLEPRDCALLVVSTGLSRYGASDLSALYEFAQKAGASLPAKELSECYGEIAVLGDEDGTPAGILRALEDLAADHLAVDMILHAHGRPFSVVCSEGPVDVVEFALAGNAELGARAKAARDSRGRDFALRLRGGFLAAEGGGGFGLTLCPRAGVEAERFTLLPLDGGEPLADAARIRIAARTGHWLRAAGGILRADAAENEASVFTVRRARSSRRIALEAGGRPVVAEENRLSLGAAGRGGTPIEARRLQPPRGIDVEGVSLSPTCRARLRAVLTTACHGATFGPAFLNLGFATAAGSLGVSADSATSFPTFLHYWKRGDSFEEAVAAANRSDPLHAQDRIASLRFRDADSRRAVFGRKDLTRTSSPRARSSIRGLVVPSGAVRR
ncbi:MAG: hypothetical protein Fur0037_12550 [Planctomycetota bacterium]